VITGQSNVTGIRPSLSILNDAKEAGFSTLIDAAALAASTRVSLQQNPSADAIAVSFYKMFGYPTGVGALIAKKSFLSALARTWFSGGTVDFVQAPGTLTLHAKDLNARFEVRPNLYAFDSQYLTWI
jgi:molybdenum cofactor sulfurtransferase